MTESEDRADWLTRPLSIPDEALREMTEAGVLALPSETGGILFPEPLGSSWIKVLSNHAPDPIRGIKFDREEIIQGCLPAIHELADWGKITIWHTHPGGGIGPSRADMRGRIKQMGNLVITITPELDGIPTWF